MHSVGPLMPEQAQLFTSVSKDCNKSWPIAHSRISVKLGNANLFHRHGGKKNTEVIDDSDSHCLS